jgi:hypothetical protein
MTIKSAVLTMILVLGLFTAADAQRPGPGPLDTMETLSNGSTAGGNLRLATGWNYVRVSSCYGYSDTQNYWLFLLGQDGSQWYTSDPGAHLMLVAACQTGNLVAFFVYNANGNWNQISTFPF